MLIATEWLQEYLSETLSPAQMVMAMERAGIEVESVNQPPQFDERIVTATVESLRPHPGADKLQLVTVQLIGASVEVVCGAPNVRVGQRVVLAQVGAHLPDGTVIKQAKIRGVVSNGMLCSQRELGLGSNHDGIIELGSEVAEGLPLSELYSDQATVIDMSTAANRPDLQSYLGVAREVAAHSSIDVIFATNEQLPITKSLNKLFINEAVEQAPQYALLKLKLDAGQSPSPPWLQSRLRAANIRVINNVVDITNYVMLETGQPLHAFDEAKLKGSISVRLASPGEQLSLLDGSKLSLSGEDIVIADQNGPVALAGVMGGSDCEITAASTHILLEVATFDSAHVRKSARRHGLRTEASARFERGLPLQTVALGLNRAVELLQELAGAELVGLQHRLDAWPWVQHIGVRPRRLSQLAGRQINSQQVVDNLRRLDFSAEEFDIAAEARKHLGKTYKWGASFKTDGTDAFDCSYFADYLYSLIGVRIGHTAYAQFETGRAVDVGELRPGDLLFRGGPWVKLKPEERGGVSHNALYVGDNKVIDVRDYQRDASGEWQKLAEKDQGVTEQPAASISQDPQFLGARRYVDKLGDYVAVTVPWWRPDVKTEEDLLEEIVKLIGLEKVPATLPTWRPDNDTLEEKGNWSGQNELRWLLYGLGLFEITTYPFISEGDIKLFKLEQEHFKLQNPRSQEQAYLRTTLLPQLAHSVVKNTTNLDEFSLFEVANVFEVQPEQILPKEKLTLAMAVYGSEARLRLKGFIDQLAGHYQLQPWYEPAATDLSLHPGRSAEIICGQDLIGRYGLLHPEVAAALKLPAGQLAIAELDFASLLAYRQPPVFRPLPKFPSSFRDLSVCIEPHVSWQQLAETLSRLPDLKASFLDEYHRDNAKIVTIHLEFVALEATLTDNQVEQRLRQVAERLATVHGAVAEL